MKYKGLDFFIDYLGIDLPTEEGMLFVPFPNIRRYEELHIKSTKKDGGIKHEMNTKYKIKFATDAMTLYLSRKGESSKLIRQNEESLQNKEIGESVNSRVHLYSKY